MLFYALCEFSTRNGVLRLNLQFSLPFGGLLIEKADLIGTGRIRMAFYPMGRQNSLIIANFSDFLELMLYSSRISQYFQQFSHVSVIFTAFGLSAKSVLTRFTAVGVY